MTDRAVFAHGFTQTARSWGEVRARLGTEAPSLASVAVDLPGHGEATDVRTNLWGAAEHLVAHGGSGAYVGYSMGGRVALHAALSRPDAVQRLVLIGATAGIDDDVERAARRASDEALAQRIEQIGVAAFVDEWLANPLFAGLDSSTALRDDRLGNSAAGLAASLRSCGTGTQQSLWDLLDDIRCPTLVLVGEHDHKFRILGERLVEGLTDSRLVVIGEAGHSVHLEAPAATVRVLADFLG